MKYSTPLTYFKSEWTNEWRKSSFHAITITTSTIFWTNISNILNNFLFQEWNISATHDALLHWNPKGKLEVDYNILFEIRQHLIPAFLQNSFAGNEWCFVWRVQDILDDLPKLFHRTTQENMIVERQLWTCSSPRCLISHFPSTKDYILIRFFFRTTQDNLIEERQFWTLSSPRCLIALFRTTKDYILIAFLSNDTRQCDCRTTVVNFIELNMFDRSLSYDKRLHFDRFPSNDTRQYVIVERQLWTRIEPKMFDRTLSYDKRLHFDHFPSNDTRQCDCRTTVVNLYRAQNVWSLTFLQQKTIFWSLFFRTTQDCSSPKCVISHFPSTKDYILIAFLSNDERQFDCRTTVVNFIEPKMFDRSLSYDKRLHFDRFPFERHKDSVIVERQLWTLSSSICLIALFRTTKDYILIALFRTTKDYILIAFLRTKQDNMWYVERQLWTRYRAQGVWSLTFLRAKDYILIAFLSHDTRLFEPKMCDLSLSFNKRLYFDRFSFERNERQYWYVERQLWTRLSPRCLISHFPTAKDYILIAFRSNDTRQCDCRTTVVNFIELNMFDRSLSYDKRLHFDRFPSNDTRQCDCRTTVVNFIELNMFDLSLSFNKRLHFDRSLSYDKRLHFDRFPSNETRQYYIRTTVVNSVEPKVFDLSLSYSKRLHFDRFSFEWHTTIWL